jgi:hypothetical protein
MTPHSARPALWVWISAIVLLSIHASGCTREVEVEPLRFLEEPQTAIETNATRGVGVVVKAAGSTALEYKWTSLRGSFHTATTKAPTNIYRAPREPGLDTITVEVVGGPSPVQRSLQIEVKGTPVPPPQPGAPQTFAYAFDAAPVEWVANATAGTTGLVRLGHSLREGIGDTPGALQLELDVDGRTASKSSAEAEVNLTQAGEVVSDPFDLSNRTIVYHVKFPADFPVDIGAPHGVQPFARDDNHRAFYGCYQDVDVAGKWIRVTFQLATTAALSCAADKTSWQQDAGFNVARVIVIGLKVGANRGNRPYRGPAYVDEVRVSQ